MIKSLRRDRVYKEAFISIVCIFILLFVTKRGFSLKIVHLSGDIYAETGTNYLSGGTWSAEGWDASGGVFTDNILFEDTTGIGAYGYASGQKINGEGGKNHYRFILSSTAQSKNGDIGDTFQTYALVRSGFGKDDMIELQLVPDAGENDKKIKITGQASLAGTLNSSGLNFLNPVLNTSFESGIAEVGFKFEIYKDPTQKPVMGFYYDYIVQNNSLTLAESSIALPGHLGKKEDKCSFKAGDKLYLYFEQIAIASVPDSSQSSAKAFAVQSTNDVISVIIQADTINSVPEPSAFILLCLALIGIFGKGCIKRY